jgi:cellulose synthase/poly-beta-1,6-N-acetylglucosamine synthase-like glycosyltransferase
MSFVFLSIASLFVVGTLFALWNVRWVRRLPSRAALFSDDTASTDPKRIRCSVVIAARDEEARVEHTIRRVLSLRGVELEIIVVDDRSRDGTTAILHAIAARNPRVHVRRVDVLPPGWLGKCHACHTGAAAATGDWILFTDADCWLAPDVLERALLVAERDGADHVTLTSGIDTRSLGLRADHILFLIGIAGWISGVNRDRPGSFIGIGAFNLVRAAAYRASGGYEALRLTVVDDVKLGLLLRRAGFRTRAFLGATDVECYWGASAWSMVHVMEKNHFAVFDYRTALVLFGSVSVLLVMCIQFIGLLTGSLAGIIAAIAPLLIILPGAVLARRIGWSFLPAFFAPFMTPLFLYSVLNSTYRALRDGGIRWRETFYPLAELRSGNLR